LNSHRLALLSSLVGVSPPSSSAAQNADFFKAEVEEFFAAGGVPGEADDTALLT
jgi:hypothetical protein